MASATGYGDAPTDEQLLAYAEIPRHARYMAEVFAVRIPATAGGDPPSGIISFLGGNLCNEYIYNSSPQEEQQACIDSQGNIVLTGPSVVTSAYGPVIFLLDLTGGQAGEADEEEERPRICCDVFGGHFSNFNRTISETVRTVYGPAEVIYAVLSNGVQARVDVKLARLQSRDEEDGVFLGRIVARSKLFDVGCVLFYNEAADKAAHVRPGELVPLARHALAVPLHMPLTIELDLRLCSGDEIVRGTLEFKTAMHGLHTERLVGVNGAEFQDFSSDPGLCGSWHQAAVTGISENFLSVRYTDFVGENGREESPLVEKVPVSDAINGESTLEALASYHRSVVTMFAGCLGRIDRLRYDVSVKLLLYRCLA